MLTHPQQLRSRIESLDINWEHLKFDDAGPVRHDLSSVDTTGMNICSKDLADEGS